MKIKELDQEVINRIAAGEIIVQPANALKELLENAIDAGATVVDILVKDGGLKLLQVTDNGSGIGKDDLPLLCQRFATLKLAVYEDLQSIATYGFRGEALASISHVAHLTVVTKTAETAVAFKSFFNNGRLTDHTFSPGSDGTPKPVAGRTGTQISIEDIFYNTPSRKRALKSKNEELIKILDVAGRYAVHSTVGITCKKFGESHNLLSTRPGQPLKERIRSVFGSLVANELIEFELSDQDKEGGLLSCKGAITSANYANKKKIPPVFFINNRLVLCEPLKRAIFLIYSYFLPKGNLAFVYLSLEIVPQNVDVNIHPTKKEVRFLNDEEIIATVSGKIHSVLMEMDSTRTYQTQKAPDNRLLSTPKSVVTEMSNIKKNRYEHKLVRTDARQQKLLFLLGLAMELEVREDVEEVTLLDPEIMALKLELIESIDRDLTEVFNNSTYIGIVDEEKRLLSFQHDIRLYVCDYGSVLFHLFYQLALENYANYGQIEFDEPVSIKKVVETLSRTSKNLGLKLANIDSIKFDQIPAEFGITISEEDSILLSLPMIDKGIRPQMSKLGHFLYRLSKVDLTQPGSKRQILEEIAYLYVPGKIEVQPENDTQREELNSHIENTIFPLLQKKFIAPRSLSKDIVQIADLPGLYRVFERC